MVQALLLDVNGTLFPPAAAASVFRDLGLAAALTEEWFACVLRDAFAAQVVGTFVPFQKFGAYHLQRMLMANGCARTDGQEAMQQVSKAWSEADMYPDVVSGVRAVRAAGVRVAALTNGSVDPIAKGVLGRAGILELVEPLMDINMAQSWKPAQQSYAYAVRQLGLAPGQVAMVASHPWDIHGAMKAGLRGVYVQRDTAQPWPTFLEPAPAVVSSFNELAGALQRME